MNDRFSEIRARVAEAQTHSVRNDPLFSDLEYALGEIDRQAAVIAWQDRVGTETVMQIDRLRTALQGLLTFRTNKDFWEFFSDEQLKPLLDDAFSKARAALEESK